MNRKNKDNKSISSVQSESRAIRERMEINMIKARLALPPQKRTGFLRRRLSNGGSVL